MSAHAVPRRQGLLRKGIAVVVVLGLLAAALVWWFGRGAHRIHVKAYFRTAVGLYVGDSVRVLGVPVGTITGVHTGRGTDLTQVEVDLAIDPAVPVAADTGAVIVPPGVISSRYVQLTQPYVSGAKLADHAVIPKERTAVPLEVDDVTRQLDQFLVALGPQGANSTGALSQFVATSAKALAGNGTVLRQSLSDVANALDTLGHSSDDIVTTLENLQTFATAIAGSDDAVRQTQTELATVSSQLAAERQQLAATITNLSTAVTKVNAFVAQNKGNLTTDLAQLADLSTTLAAHQRDLTEVLDLTPLGLEAIFGAANLTTETLDARTDLTPLASNSPTTLCQLLQGLAAGQLCTTPGTAK